MGDSFSASTHCPVRRRNDGACGCGRWWWEIPFRPLRTARWGEGRTGEDVAAERSSQGDATTCGRVWLGWLVK
jgi:hypothetical protein